jgi:hypothetical protein
MRLRHQLFLIGIYSLARVEIKKLSIKVIITNQLMGLLQSPAHAFVQTHVHNMSCLLIRKTLQMMRSMNEYLYGDKNAQSDYDDDNDDCD